MKTLTMDQMAQLEGGKFWGWETGPTSVNWNDPDCPSGISTSYDMTHYIFWIADDSVTVTTCWDAPQ